MNTMSDILQETEGAAAPERPRLPSWCPECMETDPAKFPYALPGGILGCQTCKSWWAPAELAAMVNIKDPRNPSTSLRVTA